MSNRSKQLRGSIMLLLTAIIWGFAFVSQSMGVSGMGVLSFNGVRNLVGACVLLPVIAIRTEKAFKDAPEGEKHTLFTKDAIKGGLCCGMYLFLASTLQGYGILYSTVGKSGFITAMYVLLVPVFGLFLGKKVNIKVWIGVAIAVAGLFLLCVNESLSLQKGDLLLLACAVGFTFHILVVDYFSPKADGVVMSCIQFILVGTVSTVLGFILEKPDIESIKACWTAIAYAGALSSGMGFTMQIIYQKDVEPTAASIIMSLESVFAVVGGWLILGQALSLKELMGCILMFAAIVLAQL